MGLKAPRPSPMHPKNLNQATHINLLVESPISHINPKPEAESKVGSMAPQTGLEAFFKRLRGSFKGA